MVVVLVAWLVLIGFGFDSTLNVFFCCFVGLIFAGYLFGLG